MQRSQVFLLCFQVLVFLNIEGGSQRGQFIFFFYKFEIYDFFDELGGFGVLILGWSGMICREIFINILLVWQFFYFFQFSLRLNIKVFYRLGVVCLLMDEYSIRGVFFFKRRIIKLSVNYLDFIFFSIKLISLENYVVNILIRLFFLIVGLYFILGFFYQFKELFVVRFFY